MSFKCRKQRHWTMLLLETNICRFERRLQNIFNTWLYIDESCNVDSSVQRVKAEDLCVTKRSLILLGKLVSHLIGAISKYDLFCVFDLQVQIFAGWSYKAMNTHISKHSMCPIPYRPSRSSHSCHARASWTGSRDGTITPRNTIPNLGIHLSLIQSTPGINLLWASTKLIHTFAHDWSLDWNVDARCKYARLTRYCELEFKNYRQAFPRTDLHTVFRHPTNFGRY